MTFKWRYDFTGTHLGGLIVNSVALADSVSVRRGRDTVRRGRRGPVLPAASGWTALALLVTLRRTNRSNSRAHYTTSLHASVRHRAKIVCREPALRFPLAPPLGRREPAR